MSSKIKILDARLDAMEYKLYGVKTETELLAAVADPLIPVIHLMNDITLTGLVRIARSLTIYGHGNSLIDDTLDANQYMAVQIADEGVIIRDVIFEISGNSDGNTIYSIDVGASGTIIEDCTFIMANAGSSGAVSVYYEGYAGQILSGNTFSNGVALTGCTVMHEIKNNTFAATKGIGLGEVIINGVHYNATSPVNVAAIKAYLVACSNVTTGGALVVEGYFEE